MKQARRGFALIELVTVVGATALILSISVMTIHTMYRANQRLHQTSRSIHATERLTSQFQSDAHRATSAKVSDDGFTLSMPDESHVVYSHEFGEIVRLRTASNSADRREVYRLPVGVDPSWEIMDDAGMLVILRLRRSDDPSEASDRFLERDIVAALSLEEGDE